MRDEILPEPQRSNKPAPESALESAAPGDEPPTEPGRNQGLGGQSTSEPSTTLDQDQGLDGQSFADALSAFECRHTHRAEASQLQGTVVSLSADRIFLDIGYKIEGVLPRSSFPNDAEDVKPGDRFPVSITGRNEEGYYELSRFRVAQPRDWPALERAFAKKIAVAGTVTEQVKGGLSVDIGVRAFMPLSRSGARDAAEVEALVGHEITCRITKLDVAGEDVVVDRRVVLEEQARGAREDRRAALKEGSTVNGTVRSLMPYGAFVGIGGGEIGGLEGLLHISDISYTRIAKPEDVLAVGQEIQVRILKIDAESGKISLGLKQALGDPWLEVERKFPLGSQVEGPVTKLMNFGAFVEIAEGVDGLVHISEIVADRRLNHPSDVLRQGQRVKALVLAIDPEKRQIKLSMKQLIPAGIDEYIAEHKVGDRVSGRVAEVTAAGAIVELGEGIRATCGGLGTGRAGNAPAAGAAKASPAAAEASAAKPGLAQLSSMLKARWKGNAPAPSAQPEPLAEGQVRSFKIAKLEPESKAIEVELA